MVTLPNLYTLFVIQISPRLSDQYRMVRKKSELGNHKCDEATDWNEENSHEDEEYVTSRLVPQSIMQPKFNYLKRDLNTAEIKAEAVPSRLQEWNILKRNVQTSI